MAFDFQGIHPSPQEENLGSSWELPETGKRENRQSYCVVESQLGWTRPRASRA